MRLLYLCVVAVATALSIRTLERDKTFHLLACACAWASPLLLSWSGFLSFFTYVVCLSSVRVAL
jgi:hypothetical protein